MLHCSKPFWGRQVEFPMERNIRSTRSQAVSESIVLCDQLKAEPVTPYCSFSFHIGVTGSAYHSCALKKSGRVSSIRSLVSCTVSNVSPGKPTMTFTWLEIPAPCNNGIAIL